MSVVHENWSMWVVFTHKLFCGIFWALKSSQLHSWGQTGRLFWKIQVCQIVFRIRSGGFSNILILIMAIKFGFHDVLRVKTLFLKNSIFQMLKIHHGMAFNIKIKNFTIINRYGGHLGPINRFLSKIQLGLFELKVQPGVFLSIRFMNLTFKNCYHEFLRCDKMILVKS